MGNDWCTHGQFIATSFSSSSPSESCLTADASQPGQLCRLSCMYRSQSKQNKCLHPEHCKTTPGSCSSSSGDDRSVKHPWQRHSAGPGSFDLALLRSCRHIHCNAACRLLGLFHASAAYNAGMHTYSYNVKLKGCAFTDGSKHHHTHATPTATIVVQAHSAES